MRIERAANANTTTVDRWRTTFELVAVPCSAEYSSKCKYSDGIARCRKIARALAALAPSKR